MELIYNAKKNRKELVKALVTLTQAPPAYAGPPTYNYTVGDFIVNRDGNLILPDGTDETVVQELIDSLENLGFTCIMTEKHEDLTESGEEPEPEPEVTDEEEESSKEEEQKPTGITLSFPLNFFVEDAIDRMRAIVASKQSLLKKALDTDNLDITVEGDKVSLPWFTDHGIEGEIDAYSKLAFAIAKMAITQNRVLAPKRQNADDKEAMRLFLIRLDFKGDEFREARAILMRNFNSNEARKKADAALNLCMPEVNIK